MTALVLAGVLALLVDSTPSIDSPMARSGPLTTAEAPWCGQARLSGYVRSDYGPGAKTFDGTSIFTAEKIAAASWDVRMGAIAEISGLGSYRIADRGGGLGNGDPMPWVDVATWSREEAFSLTSVRRVCFRRPTP